MKKLCYLSLVCGLVALFASCGGAGQGGLKPDPSGGPYELLVVSERSLWDSAVGDTLRAIFTLPVPTVNQREPHMDLSPVVPASYMGLLHKHRNTLLVKVGSDYTEPTMKVEYDRHAAPQIVVEVSAPNQAILTDYIWTHRAELLQIFEMAERDRYVATINRKNHKELSALVAEKFGFQVSVPTGYTLRQDSTDFLWLSYEMPVVSQGIVIYSYPYTGKEDFTADSLVAKRNRFVAQIPGPAEGSHMITADVPVDLQHKSIHGRFWSEMHSFWDVKGDFMGGPFVSYSTLDTQTKQVICIEGYVYSPRKHKRNYLRELENLIYTVKFPTAE